MPPPKEHFSVRTPPGTSVDEVIDALEGLVGIQDLYSVQHHGGFDFQVGVNSVAAVQTLLETGGLRLGTRTVPLVPVARQVASVTCLCLPCYVPDNEVVTGLKSYGTTLRIEEARYKDRPSIRTGRRYIKMDMRLENPLPNFARGGGVIVRLSSTAAYVVFAAAATRRATSRRNATPRTAPDTCTEPCRRCGGAHASVDCTARKSYSMAAAMDVDKFPALGTATAAGQTQRRMTTLRPAKRPKPNEDGPEPQVIPEKTLAQAAAITAPAALAQQQEGRQTDAPTPANMRSGERQEEEGTHGHAEPNQAAAATEAERAADSGEGEKRVGPALTKRPLRRAATRTVKASGRKTAQRRAKGHRETESRALRGGRAGSQYRCAQPLVEQDKRRRRAARPGGPAARKRPSEATAARAGAEQQHRREEAQHGVQHGEAGGKTSRGEKTAVLEAQKPAGTPSSDEPGVGRGRNSRSRDSEAAHGGNLFQSLRPSGPGAHKADGGRPQRSVKKVRRDAAGRLRSRTSGSEHEEATSKQRPSQRPAADDMDTDSDFF
ncbi:hypothetical protein HPB52_003446 [Rhipicephalus sanguineus]|uniref:Uncharacterized protein n=1 Tax=Rhipicephalus sanguineus TaxID=34632 RepID=A0A9D4T8F9_RHISA|nr:hypothetical protein HPB52_003446 [Rhipicephalus sanguineus]